MRKQYMNKIIIGLVIAMFCTSIFYHQMVGTTNAQSMHDYWAEDTNLDVPVYYYVYASLSSGDEITGLIQSHASAHGFNFFVCDQTNFDLYEGGFSCSVYHLDTSMHVLHVDFTVPSSETWYFVIENDEIFTIELDYYLERNGDDSPFYSPTTYDFVDNYENLNIGDFVYYSLGELRKGDTLLGEYATTFDTDSVLMMILSEYEKDRYLLGHDPVPLYYKNGYYRASIGPVEIPANGGYFIVFDAWYEDDTITFSYGLNLEKGFPLVAVLIGAGAGVVALAVIIPVSIVASKKKKARMQSPPPSQPGVGAGQAYGQPPSNPPPQPQPTTDATNTGKQFCDKCGMKLQPGVAFCPGCGVSINK